MSLPYVLKLSANTLWDEPYLEAEPARVEKWRQFLAACAGFRVGICWQGNPQHMFDSQRSFPLEALSPIARVSGVRLVNLQKGMLAAAGFEVIDLGPDFDASAGAFVDSAAVIKSLDLVITADTALAHLAGGLGAPVWVALSAHSDWRWVKDRDDSPWYPTMRLFRQQRLGEWDEVFARVADELRRQIDEGRQAGSGSP
jgi:hypothetical protein